MGKDKNFTEPISIRITPEMDKKISGVSASEGLNKQDSIRRLLHKGLEAWAEEQEFLELMKDHKYKAVAEKLTKKRETGRERKAE